MHTQPLLVQGSVFAAFMNLLKFLAEAFERDEVTEESKDRLRLLLVCTRVAYG